MRRAKKWLQFPLRKFFGFPPQLSPSLTILAVAVVITLCSASPLCQSPANSAVPPAPHAKQIHLKHVLVISQTKGWEHDSVPEAMDAVFTMGKESGLWDTTLRTDTELLTKRKDLGRNAKNLDYFDVVVFASTTVDSPFASEFQSALEGQGVKVAGISIDQRDPEKRYLPGHPDAGPDGYVAFPRMNPAEEMVDLMGASNGYQANVAAMTSIKEMLQQSISLLK